LLSAASLPWHALGHVAAFVAAFALHRGTMSCSQAANLLHQHRRNVATLTRFLSEVGHSPNLLACARSAALLLEAEFAQPGDFLFLLDGTKRHSQGRHLENSYSCGNTKRTPRKERNGKGQRKQYKNHKSRCHAFICGLLLTPGGLRLPYCRPYYTREHCEQLNRPFHTDAELAAQMIAALELPDTAQVVVVGDTAYDAAVIRAACFERDYRWVVPVNPERVLAGKKNRRKVRALQEDLSVSCFVPVRLSLGQGPHRQQRRLSPSRGGPGKYPQRTYWVHRRTEDVHSVGMVVLLFSKKNRPGQGQLNADKILMSNAFEATAEELVAWYDLRWQIELFFKECKSVLGLDHYRVGKFVQVEGWVELCLLTFCYLEWYRATQLLRTDLDREARRHWQSARAHDLCQLVRQRLEEEEVELMCTMMQTAEGRRELAAALRDACAATSGSPRAA
jgi:hypothetical protein